MNYPRCLIPERFRSNCKAESRVGGGCTGSSIFFIQGGCWLAWSEQRQELLTVYCNLVSAIVVWAVEVGVSECLEVSKARMGRGRTYGWKFRLGPSLSKCKIPFCRGAGRGSFLRVNMDNISKPLSLKYCLPLRNCLYNQIK